ncbi:MAG: DUF397 domain-containing protein [Candidatus Pacebacteria bacterium]|nr:DUF397 domain-containing protein [Candidatus Paceibacterota bacterium]
MTTHFKDEDFRTPQNVGMCDPHGMLVCVSVAIGDDSVAVRDTKDPKSGTQEYSHEEWRRFIEAVKQGQFDV